jgi:hypothetical protein
VSSSSSPSFTPSVSLSFSPSTFPSFAPSGEPLCSNEDPDEEGDDGSGVDREGRDREMSLRKARTNRGENDCNFLERIGSMLEKEKHRSVPFQKLRTLSPSHENHWHCVCATAYLNVHICMLENECHLSKGHVMENILEMRISKDLHNADIVHAQKLEHACT